ncbi:hypothetical protein MAR_018779 [Mya arenaria]|uniref:Uncharacterized protein n=1 Tax=Mya arenaria TaxID=6604 RepID=A0ABY7EJ57_MYAAR|nr:hypothetical protein MAR_018779 [Mya arenaria]
MMKLKTNKEVNCTREAPYVFVDKSHLDVSVETIDIGFSCSLAVKPDSSIMSSSIDLSHPSNCKSFTFGSDPST